MALEKRRLHAVLPQAHGECDDFQQHLEMAVPPVAWLDALATAAEDALTDGTVLGKELVGFKRFAPHHNQFVVHFNSSHGRDLLISLETIDRMNILSAKGPMLRKPHLNLLCRPPDPRRSKFPERKNGPS